MEEPKPKRQGNYKAGPGRDRIELSDGQIEQVASGVGLGLSLDDMAKVLDISPSTLDRRVAEDKKWREKKRKKKNLFDAIEKSKSGMKAQLMTKAFNMAMGKHGSKETPAMVMFLLKARYGLRETSVIEGNPEAPLRIESKASKEEVAATLKELIAEATAKGTKFE